MAKKASKKARKKATAKTSRKAKKARRAPVTRRRKSARSKTRRSRPRAKAGSAFQLMIETINEAERLRTKNERRDVTDETG